jgi:cytochrome c biogenesis protein CcmG/thiol:disulfide interchange protein DsbE
MTNNIRMACRRTAVLLAALAALVLAPSVIIAASLLAPGQPAPTLTLKAPDGRPLSLAAMKGRPVLVDFWASWCPPCRTSVPALEDLYREFHPRGLEVVAINVDERRKDADAFLVGRQYTMPIIFDTEGQSPRDAGVYGMPTSFLVGRDGKIRFVHRGYSDKVHESYRQEIELLLAEGQPNK